MLLPQASLYLLGFYENYSWNNEFNYELLIGFFILNWSGDTGAYLVGSAIGKNKLLERISPKKTIEGSLGGLILTVLIAYFISMVFKQVSLLDWIIVAILIVIFGTAGDLFESMIKRKAEVKDSGTLIPGHGGILDRFDSILFSAPVVFIYLNIIGQ
jgi:phosphatidate cytidylyltransferase